MYFWYSVVIDKIIALWLIYNNFLGYVVLCKGLPRRLGAPCSDNQFMKEKFILILPNIRSGHNVGAIFRTADGAGVDKLYLTGYTPCPPHQNKNA